MLSLHSRSDQLFLVDYRKAAFSSFACCSISDPLQFKTAKTDQQQNQHKKSLRIQQKRERKDLNETFIVELSATLPRNLKRKTTETHLSDSDHTMHQLRINRIQSQQISLNQPSSISSHHIIPPFATEPNIQPQSYLAFTYRERRSQIYQHTNTELGYVKENENIEQTTCLEFQSQESIPHFFGKPARIISPPINKQQASDERPRTLRQCEDWSDESLSSETKVRFQQINEEQSFSDSHSAHHKNKVAVVHNHSPTFQQFRKTHSIRSKLSDSSSHFSGRSIVLEKQHNFLTPHRHRYFYNDY